MLYTSKMICELIATEIAMGRRTKN